MPESLTSTQNAKRPNELHTTTMNNPGRISKPAHARNTEIPDPRPNDYKPRKIDSTNQHAPESQTRRRPMLQRMHRNCWTELEAKNNSQARFSLAKTTTMNAKLIYNHTEKKRCGLVFKGSLLTILN